MLCPDQRATIVVVDDDHDVLTAVARMLRSFDVHVLATGSAHEALDWVATREVAVIVSDFEMPRMNGIEVLSAARCQQATTVRVLMTGMQALETAVEAINRGELFRYVQKPFHASQLRAVVSEALVRHHELALAAADHDHTVRRQRYNAELETAYPGILATRRDDEGSYVIPDVCNAEAVRMLGLGPS